MKIYTKTQEILCDTITPISAFLSLRDEYANVSLFESSDYSSKENSKSYIGISPILTYQVFGRSMEVRKSGKLINKIEIANHEEINEAIGEVVFTDALSHDQNGFFGVIGYDAIPLFEEIEFKKKGGELPDVFLACYKFVLEFDHYRNRLKILFNSFNEQQNELFEIMKSVNRSVAPTNSFKVTSKTTSSETDESFKQKVAKVKDHVAKGDVFQLVISRRFSCDFEGDDFELYRQLRTINPSPYMFYFDLDKGKLIGASPEAQVKLQKGRAEIHPIAGTVRRTANEEENQAQILHLRNDEKENAEHIMLVDLARNDLNMNCTDVQVEKLKEVQTFSHVIHLVSKVTGRVSEASTLKVFGGSFPAGTLSGAPKYKAMELIDKYENVNRQYYGGAIGFISASGNMNMAIVIRTALSHQGKLFYQAGAGVVQDSTESGECQEVYNKVRAVELAIQKANQNH
jgi:anthranilate synthase component 1